MDILHFGKYYWPEYGGIETAAKDLAELGAELGYDVRCVVSSEHIRRTRKELTNGVSITRHPQFAKVLSAPLSPHLFLYRVTEPTIVHIHLPHPVAECAALAGMFFGTWRKVTFIPYLHAIPIRQGRLGRWWFKLITARLLDRSRNVLVSNEYVAVAFPNLVRWEKKLEIVPFHTKIISDAEFEFCGAIRSESNQVLAVGRLVSYKGYDVLLRAWAEILRRGAVSPFSGPAPQLTIVGDGPERAALERLSNELGLDAASIITGSLSEPRKEALLESASVFVTPSISEAETFGITILEAQAHGLPVVVSRLPTGVRLLARGGECGAEVPPQDNLALADAIENLLRASPKRRHAIGAANLTFVRANFSRETCRNRYAEVLRHATPALGEYAPISTLARTARDAATLLFGQFAAAAVGFAVNLLLIRRMSVGDFGLFSIFNSSFMLLSGVLHFGWADTFVRFGSKYRDEAIFETLKRRVFLRAAIASGIMSAAIAVGSPWIAMRIWPAVDGTWLLRAAAISAFFNTFGLLALSAYRVSTNFLRVALVNFMAARLKLGLLGGIAFFGAGRIGLAPSVGVYVAVAAVMAAAIFDRKARPRLVASPGERPIPETIGREVSRHNRWLFFNIVTFTLIGNLDALMLASYRDTATVAAFAVTARLTLPFTLAAAALSSAISPRIAAAQSRAGVRASLVPAFAAVAPMSVLLALVAAFGSSALLKIAGHGYANSLLLMKLQLLSAALAILWQMPASALQAMGHSRSVALLSFFQLIGDVTLNRLWIPGQGANGAVRSSIAIHLFALAWIAVEWQRKIGEEAR